MKVLVTDSISEEGLALLRDHAQVDVKTGDVDTQQAPGVNFHPGNEQERQGRSPLKQAALRA